MKTLPGFSVGKATQISTQMNTSHKVLGKMPPKEFIPPKPIEPVIEIPRIPVEECMLFDSFLAIESIDSFKSMFKKLTGKSEITGIYLICNAVKNKWYVGQGVKAVSRCLQHFRVRENSKDNVPEVREDFEAGDTMLINFIRQTDTQFDTLDELEFYYIGRYDCVNNGYNHQRGNKTNK